MKMWKFLKSLLYLGLFLFLKIPGLLWLTGGIVFLGGMLYLAKRFQKRMPIFPVLIWTVCIVSILFFTASRMPDIRIIDLLYL